MTPRSDHPAMRWSAPPAVAPEALRPRTVVQRIEDLILAEGLAPGDPMPTETQLCERLGVSRSSIRESMRTLATLDIVEVRHGHGSFVGRLSLAPLVDGMIFRARMNVGSDLRTLREVVEVRIALDLSITDQLIEAHRSRDVTELSRHVERMREQASRGEPFPDADSSFHAELAAPLGNELVQQLGAAFWQIHTAATPLLGVPLAEDILDTVDAHQAMLDALVAGEAEAYRSAVQAHYRPLLTVLDARS